MHLCVTQTIEKAITELIRKGINKKVWRAAEETVAQVKKVHSKQPSQIKKATAKVTPQVARTIYFDYNKVKISEQAAKTLSSQAKYLLENPEKKIRLEGHADERGNAQYNMTLGKDRAIAAAQNLLQKGVNAKQMLVTSLGEKQPVKTGATESAYASNRRVELEPVE